MTLKSMPRWFTVVIAVTLLLTGCTSSGSSDQPTPDALTESESEALIQARIDEAWSRAGQTGDRPTVKIVRLVSLFEWPDAIAKCLNDAGYDNVSAVDGGLEIRDILEEQRSAMALAQYICEAQYPTDPKYNVPLNESQLSYLYDYLKNEQKPCLEKAGYTISEPPSEQKFIESYYRTGGWQPYSELPSGNAGNEMEKSCPQIPTGLWGEQ
jgi:uncharacterized protein YceK